MIDVKIYSEQMHIVKSYLVSLRLGCMQVSSVVKLIKYMASKNFINFFTCQVTQIRSRIYKSSVTAPCMSTAEIKSK